MSTLELWAGVEPSCVRVGDAYIDELELTGHTKRVVEDMERIAALGAKAVRFPVLWERTAPLEGAPPSWTFSDDGLAVLRDRGLRAIVGLVHHGSGPRHTSLLDDSFVTGLATFARSVAERYPWVADYTPVNEPLTTARFSGLYGHWYPHARDARSFVRALLVECRAIRAAMRAIREVVPGARLVQTEDVCCVYATPRLTYQASFENERRFLSFDLLAGRVGPGHPLRGWLVDHGVDPRDLDDFGAAPCPPDIIGLNYYVTSDRFLDHRIEHYPSHLWGGNAFEHYADIEAVRVREEGLSGHRSLLELLWDRYRTPLAITETHLGCAPEEQIRWLREAWEAARSARASGADVRAVTLWSVFGACDWDSLLTKPQGHYEPGAFDVRGAAVRPTAVARVARDLATKDESEHPLLAQAGWWRRPERLLYRMERTRTSSVGRSAPSPSTPAPLLVCGAAGTLGRAVVRICERRNIPVVGLTRRELDVRDRHAVQAALERHRPWAVVNASGYVRVDAAEDDRDGCFDANVQGAIVVAEACAARAIRHAMFSSDLVFDGSRMRPYVETDPVAPLNVYGRSKAAAERALREVAPGAVVVRTSAFFGPWDEANFVHGALTELRAGRPFFAAADQVVSPTYVPDLADAVVTLLVDGARGLWHLASPGAISWADLARAAARLASIPTERLVACPSSDLGLAARRPRYSVLASERGSLLRSLEEVLALFVRDWTERHDVRASGTELATG